MLAEQFKRRFKQQAEIIRLCSVLILFFRTLLFQLAEHVVQKSASICKFRKWQKFVLDIPVLVYKNGTLNNINYKFYILSVAIFEYRLSHQMTACELNHHFWNSTIVDLYLFN